LAIQRNACLGYEGIAAAHTCSSPARFQSNFHDAADSTPLGRIFQYFYLRCEHVRLHEMLDFLRSLTAAEALSPRHLDNDDRVDDVYDSEASSDGDDPQASNEDDPEIKLLLPSILSFLDLSSLELKEIVPNRLPLPLLLRQEYEDISKLIENEDQTGKQRRFGHR